LDWSTKRQLALLNSMFDIVVPIENGSDFRILEGNRKLEDLVGRPMKSQTIFSCCGSDEARSQLRKLLTSTSCAVLTSTALVGKTSDEVVEGKRISRTARLSAWLHQHWWWSLVPPTIESSMPVAPMIRTTWECSQQNNSCKQVHVEVVATPAMQSTAQKTGSLVLALRLVAHPEQMEFATDVEMDVLDSQSPASVVDQLYIDAAARARLHNHLEPRHPIRSYGASSGLGSETRDSDATDRQSDTQLSAGGSGDPTTPPPSILGHQAHQGEPARVYRYRAVEESVFAQGVIGRLNSL